MCLILSFNTIIKNSFLERYYLDSGNHIKSDVAQQDRAFRFDIGTVVGSNPAVGAKNIKKYFNNH